MKKILSIVISAVLLVLTLTATVSVEAASVNTSQTYKVYNAKTSNYIKSYTLDPNAIEDKSRTVFGEDDRVVDFTKNGVVKIVRNDGAMGTGFVVDSHTIATAAHCVYDYVWSLTNEAYYGIPSCGKTIEHIYFFNTNGNVTMDITNAKEVHVPKQYIDFKIGREIHDYALITVEQDLSAYINFNLGIMMDNFKFKHKQIINTGFPQMVNNQTVNTINNHVMYTGNGYVVNHEALTQVRDTFNPNIQFCFSCDSTPGNSGGPIYISSSYDGKIYYTVIGICVLQEDNTNYATRITTDLLHFYKNNPNISY